MRRGAWSAVAVLVAWTGAAPGQVFRTTRDAVGVDVLVTSGNRPIGGLVRGDFELLDNGVPQTIEDVTIDEVPFSMLLVLDTSESMAGAAIRDLRIAASAAVNALGARDRAAVLTFSDALQQPARWLPKGAELTRAIDGVEASGATALFDATFAGLATRDPDPGRRSLMLIFSDGDDTSSWLPHTAPIDKAARTDTVVYTVLLAPGRGRSVSAGRAQADKPIVSRANDGPTDTRRLLFRSGIRLTPGAALLAQSPFLEEIADRTGGEALAADTGGKLRDTFERIVTDFRSRYLLTYVPQGVDAGGWHKLEVRLKGRAGKVSARRGYDRGEAAR